MTALLAGCSSSSSNSGTNPESNVSSTLLGQKWASESNLKAETIANDLIDIGVCSKIVDNTDGAYDYMPEYKLGAYLICKSQNPVGSGSQCSIEVYINAGPNATLYDPKRPLSYEDGMSVALFYDDNYQVEFSPIDQYDYSSTDMVDRCSDLVASAESNIGGSVTIYGEYDYSEPTQDPTPQVETVSMPNLVGMYDGQAKTWLFQNGYKFSFNVQSTGYNPKTSCLMSGNNLILSQSPAANSSVLNQFSTSVRVYVNCEW